LLIACALVTKKAGICRKFICEVLFNMQLAAEYVLELPRLDWYIKNIFRKQVYNDKRVWEALLKWSTLDEATALEALSHGHTPILKLKGSMTKTETDNGHFRPSEPHFISCGYHYAKAIDGGIEHGTLSWQQVKAFEGIVLHEMVHWGRCRNGVSDEFELLIKGKLKGTYWDNGLLFKSEAYNNKDAEWEGSAPNIQLSWAFA
jgi:hypothetical protein